MSSERKRITFERVYKAPLADVWDLWTTPRGIESWWGPEGFQIRVTRMELRKGGRLEYEQRAVDPNIAAYLEGQGQKAVSLIRCEYTEVTPRRRLAYRTRTDFIPDVEPYDVETEVELSAVAGGIRMLLIQHAMHDERWTQMAAAGWESELGRLERSLQARTG